MNGLLPNVGRNERSDLRRMPVTTFRSSQHTAEALRDSALQKHHQPYLGERSKRSPRYNCFVNSFQKHKPHLPSSAVRGPFSSAVEKTVSEVLKRKLSEPFDVSKWRVFALPQKLSFRREPEGRVCRGRLLFAYFLLAKQEKVSRRQGGKGTGKIHLF